MKIRFLPTEKTGKLFSFHNGLDWERFSDRKRYVKQLKEHSKRCTTAFNLLHAELANKLFEAKKHSDFKVISSKLVDLELVSGFATSNTSNDQYRVSRILRQRVPEVWT